MTLFKPNPTPDESAALRAAMQAKKACPEFEVKRLAGIREHWDGRRHSEASRKAMSDRAKAAWSKRRALGTAVQNFSESHRKTLSENVRKINADPMLSEKRRLRAAKATATPELKVKRQMNARALAIKKRGFVVPEKHRQDYVWLTQSKRLSAREAGKVLGII